METASSDTSATKSPVLAEKAVADENWSRYLYGRDRGHQEYCHEAKRLEGYYLGGGEQWDAKDRAVLAAQKRMPLEFNEIMPAINSALGYQIANRLDIAFQPRGGAATQELASTNSKLAMQIAHLNKLHWRETQVFSDGLIQRRGYYEVRISTDDHIQGEAEISDLDPLDVIPDPDAKTYEPDGWSDVIVTRWFTLDQIEQFYGKAARRKVEASIEGVAPVSEDDWGENEEGDEPRNKFGDELTGNGTAYDAVMRDKHLTRVRIIDRQKWVYEMSDVIVSLDTGDVRVVATMKPETVQQSLAEGWVQTRRMAKRVRWIVSTYDTVLHDDWSPYPFFTVIPYFPYFRRGKTRGMVDNAVGPQNALNKLGSQYIHVVNSSANSGWLIEENSLTNCDTDDLEDNGAKTGIVLEYKKGATKPEKIKPNDVPAGIDKMIDRLTLFLKETTVPDSARGLEGDEKSGIAIQSRQYAAQKQLAMVLDNLGRTRLMLAKAILWMIQNYYDYERIIRITKKDPETGQPQDEIIEINKFDPFTGTIMNDMRVGEYDVVISETPQEVTFENGQFEQGMRMREAGVNIPDDVLIRNSALADKNELVQRMSQQQEKPDPLTEAEIRLKLAQASKAENDAVAKSVEAQYSGIQTAQTIAQVPQTAPLADQLLRSAGFVDRDPAPIYPEPVGALPAIDMPENTNPLTPANPGVGLNQGIETPEADGVIP